jgi:hypothetical protein
MCKNRRKGTVRAGFILIAIGTLVLSLAALPGVHAWSNGGYSSDPNNPDYGTHDWIAEKALSSQTRDVTFLTTTYHAQYLLGTEAPDNPAYIGDSTNHHAYYYSGGSIQDDVGAARASAMYQTVLGYLRTGDYGNAAFYIGAMAHYISDVGVFGHTMGASTDWGTEAHHSDYENEFEARLGTISTPSIVLGNLAAYSATTGLAYTITFGSGTIKSNVWMDANYDWSDSVFSASAIASLYASVGAVAAAINHLLIEAGQVIPEFGIGATVFLSLACFVAVFEIRRLSRR